MRYHHEDYPDIIVFKIFVLDSAVNDASSVLKVLLPTIINDFQCNVLYRRNTFLLTSIAPFALCYGVKYWKPQKDSIKSSSFLL